MRRGRGGLAAASGVAVIALCLTGCGGGSTTGVAGNDGSPVRGGTLKIIGQGGADNLDPTNSYTTTTNALMRTYTRQLFGYPASTDPRTASTPVADAAAEIPTTANGGLSADGRTYTIKIRQGVMWASSPPRPVVAQDFVRAFKHMCNPVKPVGSPNYYLPLIKGMQAYCNPYLNNTSIASDLPAMEAYEDGHQIPGVQAVDTGTIRFQLNEPASDFLNLLSMTFTSAMPQEYYKYTPGSLQEYNHLISAGPYQVRGYSPGKSLVLVRNPAWKKSTDPLRNQYVDTIQITEGQPNPQAVLQLLQSGSQDLSYDVAMDPSTLSQLAGRNDPDLTVNGPPIGNPYLVFNLLSKNEGGAMGKVQVRQAIQYAVNKTNLAKVYGGPKYNTPLNGVVPPDSVGYKDFNLYPTPNNQGDPAKCKQLLAQAGYPNGLTLKATYRQTGVHPLIYQSYAQDLAACGIKVTGTAQQGADFYAYLQTTNNARQSKWDISAPGWAPDWFGNNGRANLQPLFSGQNWADGTSNYGDYNSPVTNALIEKANTSRTETDANAAWQAVNEQVMKDAVIVPFMAQKTPWYHSSRVRHAIWVPISQQFDYTNLWLS